MRTIAFMILSILALMPMMSSALSAAPLQPMDVLRPRIETAIAVLTDPEYTAESRKSAQREKIWEIVQPLFDFRSISMLTLARSWQGLTDDQKKNFIEAFTQLLKNSYIGKLQGNFHNETVRFDGQDTLTERKAAVRTTVLRGKTETPIEYSMLEQNGNWFVYDIKIEGVSLVKNYRTQFGQILEKESPDALIRRIQDKNKEITSGKAGSGIK